jgi:hypothetical protein
MFKFVLMTIERGERKRRTKDRKDGKGYSRNDYGDSMLGFKYKRENK